MNKIKALLCTILFIGSSQAIDIPRLDGLVTDKADVLDATQEELLENKLEALAADTGISIGVLTIKTLKDYPIEMFTLDVARKSGLGLEDKDTGALYTIAINDRKQRIEVGYGLEGSLTDATTFNIQEDAKPLLSQGDYAGAINQIVDNMILASNGEYIYIERGKNTEISAELTFIDVAIFVVFFMFFFGFLFAKSKKIWHGGVAGGLLSFLFAIGKGVPTMAGYTIGGIIIGLVIDYLLSNSKGGHGGGGFTIGGGSSSSGGGFSGFGGGSFGGGGSSSSW